MNPDAYMPPTPFTPTGYYSVEIDDDGVRVDSECCAEYMSDETAMALRDALLRRYPIEEPLGG